VVLLSERSGFTFREKWFYFQRETKGNKKYMHLIPYSIRYGYFHSERNGFSFNEKWFFFQREVVFLSKRNGRREKMYAFNSLLDTI
jgi:hypothetical protein